MPGGRGNGMADADAVAGGDGRGGAGEGMPADVIQQALSAASDELDGMGLDRARAVVRAALPKAHGADEVTPEKGEAFSRQEVDALRGQLAAAVRRLREEQALPESNLSRGLEASWDRRGEAESAECRGKCEAARAAADKAEARKAEVTAAKSRAQRQRQKAQRQSRALEKELAAICGDFPALLAAGAGAADGQQEHLESALDVLDSCWGEDTLARACKRPLCLPEAEWSNFEIATMDFLRTNILADHPAEAVAEKLHKAQQECQRAEEAAEAATADFAKAREELVECVAAAEQADSAMAELEARMAKRAQNRSTRLGRRLKDAVKAEKEILAVERLLAALPAAADEGEELSEAELEPSSLQLQRCSPIKQLAEEVMELVKRMSNTGAAAAYAPQQTPKKYARGKGGPALDGEALEETPPPAKRPLPRETPMPQKRRNCGPEEQPPKRERQRGLAVKLAELMAAYRSAAYEAELDDETEVAVRQCMATVDEKLSEVQRDSWLLRRLAQAKRELAMGLPTEIMLADTPAAMPTPCRSLLQLEDGRAEDKPAMHVELWRPASTTLTPPHSPWAAALLRVAEELAGADFSLGVVLGGTGVGKTRLLTEIRRRDHAAPAGGETLHFEADLALASHAGFAALPGGAAEWLPLAGLNDVPAWTRPFHSLSEGQRARAALALSLRSGATLDDFAATVDEVAARSCAAAIGKAVRRMGLKRVLLATSRSSLVPFLGADWVVQLPPAGGSLGSLRALWNPIPANDRKPRVELTAPGLAHFTSGVGGGWAGRRDTGLPAPSQVRAGACGRPAEVVRADAAARRPRVLSSRVRVDDAVMVAAGAFDYTFDGKATFELYAMPVDRLPKAWGLGVVVGPSGTGKSTILCSTEGFGPMASLSGWDSARPVAQQLEKEVGQDCCAALLGAVGFPEGCASRPLGQLSAGEQHLALLARALGSAGGGGGNDNAVCVDEFTSSLDRATACTVAEGLAKQARATSCRLVLAGVHSDVLDRLQPDWVYHTGERRLVIFSGSADCSVAVAEAMVEAADAEEAPSQERGSESAAPSEGAELFEPPVVRVELRRLERELQTLLWRSDFERHHYLRGDLQRAAYCFVAREVGSERLVAFHGTLPQPGCISSAYREHRLVVLPEWQGLGLGPRISDLVAQRFLAHRKLFYAVTAHPRLGQHRTASEVWAATTHNLEASGSTGRMGFGKPAEDEEEEQPVRLLYRHVFVGGDPKAYRELYKELKRVGHQDGKARGKGRAASAQGDVTMAAAAEADPSSFVRVPPATPQRADSCKWQTIDLTMEESERMSFFVRSEDPRLAALAPDHPDALAEPKNLVSIKSPDLTDEVLCVPAQRVQMALSSCQLETCLHAARRFRSTLPSGEAAGYYLGDGTGCGKGRQIASLIVHLWNQGVRRHVWVSASWDLLKDARRDLCDVMPGVVPLLSMQRAKDYTQGLEEQLGAEGVLFVTYETLAMSQSSGRGKKRRLEDTQATQMTQSTQPSELGAAVGRSRVQQVVEWLGGDTATGLVCFDEAHKAKNLTSGPGNKQASSVTALCVADLQKQCPKARVLYATATAAVELKNLAYMSRLGLWGPSTPFEDFEAFRATMSSEGLAGMEMINMDMKALGLYSARSLSWHETAFDTSCVVLSDKDKQLYDDAVLFFFSMGERLKRFMEHPLCTVAEKRRRFLPAQLRGLSQRFFKQLMLSMKVPSAVEVVRQALASDMSVVISLWTTGEARLKAAVEEASGEGEEMPELFLRTPQLMLEHFLKHTFAAESSEGTWPQKGASPKGHGDQVVSAALQQRPRVPREGLGCETISALLDGRWVPTIVKKLDFATGLVSLVLLQDCGSSPCGSEREVDVTCLRRDGQVFRPLVRFRLEGGSSPKAGGWYREDGEHGDAPLFVQEGAKPRSRHTVCRAASAAAQSAKPLRRAAKSVFGVFGFDMFPSDSEPDDAEPAAAAQYTWELRGPGGKVLFEVPGSKDSPNLAGWRLPAAQGGDGGEAASAPTVEEVATYPAGPMAWVEKELAEAQAELRALGPRLPNNPLDELIDRLGGPSAVAEMSGRGHRLQRSEDGGGALEYVKRTACGTEDTERVNVSEQEAFQDGRKRVALITEAASAGISLHADRRFKERDDCGRERSARRRLMVVLELPWAAEKAVQQFGRVHRSNQVSAPSFKILVTDLGGERRFVAAVSRRMKQLGAITKGDRRAALGDSDAGNIARFDFFTRQGKEALEVLYEDASRYTRTFACGGTEADKREGLKLMLYGPLDPPGSHIKGPKIEVRDFLNRLLVVPTAMQQAVFSAFARIFERKTREAEVRGELDAGVRSLGERHGEWEVIPSEKSRELLYRDPRTGAETHAVHLELDKGFAWEHALRVFGGLKGTDPNEGFYQDSFFDIGYKDRVWHLGHYLLVVASRPMNTFGSDGLEGVPPYYDVYYPHTGRHTAIGGKVVTPELLQDLLQHKLRKVSPAKLGSTKLREVEKGWRKQFKDSVTKCLHLQHDQRCKNKRQCTTGVRRFPRTIISGNILSIYGYVRDAICPNSYHMGLGGGTAGRLELTKAVTQEGGRVVGVEVFPGELNAVRHSLQNAVKRQVSRPMIDLDLFEELQEALVQLASADPSVLSSARAAHRALLQEGWVDNDMKDLVKAAWSALEIKGLPEKMRDMRM